MVQKSSPQLVWSLRCLSAASLFMGVGFIIWACVLQLPVETALPIGLVILGTLALILALVGVLSSVLGRGCLSVFLFVTTLVTIGELAIIITLFTDLDGAAQDLTTHELETSGGRRRLLMAGMDGVMTHFGRKMLASKKDKAEADAAAAAAAAAATQDYDNIYNSKKTSLEIGRYIFLVAVLIQMVALMVTIVMKVRHPHDDDMEEYNAHAQTANSAMAQIQLENLKHSVLKSKSTASTPGDGDGNFYTSSNKLYKSVTKKMSQKYGDFTQDVAFKQKWWQKMPGFK